MGALSVAVHTRDFLREVTIIFITSTIQISLKRREAKSKEEKETYPFECRVPKNSKER